MAYPDYGYVYDETFEYTDLVPNPPLKLDILTIDDNFPRIEQIETFIPQQPDLIPKYEAAIAGQLYTVNLNAIVRRLFAASYIDEASITNFASIMHTLANSEDARVTLDGIFMRRPGRSDKQFFNVDHVRNVGEAGKRLGTALFSGRILPLRQTLSYAYSLIYGTDHFHIHQLPLNRFTINSLSSDLTQFRLFNLLLDTTTQYNIAMPGMEKGVAIIKFLLIPIMFTTSNDFSVDFGDQPGGNPMMQGKVPGDMTIAINTKWTMQMSESRMKLTSAFIQAFFIPYLERYREAVNNPPARRMEIEDHRITVPDYVDSVVSMVDKPEYRSNLVLTKTIGSLISCLNNQFWRTLTSDTLLLKSEMFELAVLSMPIWTMFESLNLYQSNSMSAMIHIFDDNIKFFHFKPRGGYDTGLNTAKLVSRRLATRLMTEINLEEVRESMNHLITVGTYDGHSCDILLHTVTSTSAEYECTLAFVFSRMLNDSSSISEITLVDGLKLPKNVKNLTLWEKDQLDQRLKYLLGYIHNIMYIDLSYVAAVNCNVVPPKGERELLYSGNDTIVNTMLEHYIYIDDLMPVFTEQLSNKLILSDSLSLREVFRSPNSSWFDLLGVFGNPYL